MLYSTIFNKKVREVLLHWYVKFSTVVEFVEISVSISILSHLKVRQLLTSEK